MMAKEGLGTKIRRWWKRLFGGDATTARDPAESFGDFFGSKSGGANGGASA
jgi:hypothetical protein